MSKLTDAAHKILQETTDHKRTEDERRFIELLTFSSVDDITVMLDEIMAESFIEFPV